MGGEHGINAIKPGAMLPLTERERQELLAEVDRKLSELDRHQDDVQTHGDDT